MQRFAILALLASLLATACRPRNLEEEAGTDASPPPAAALAAEADTLSLERKLARLEGLIRVARQSDDAEIRELRVMEAEALTDRLLESELPFQWLANQYSVESRLRQLQALADRVVSRIRRGETGVPLNDDLDYLAANLQALRSELGRAGGPAPPPIDSLLATGPDAAGGGAGGAPPEEEEDDEPALLGEPTAPTPP